LVAWVGLNVPFDTLAIISVVIFSLVRRHNQQYRKHSKQAPAIKWTMNMHIKRL